MEEKIYCNICDEVIYVKDIENHITNSIHKKSKKEYLQQLSSVERDNKITNESTYSIWNSNTNSNVI
ncbi:MAG TPA: hypothetical protein VFU79_02200 [Nitrososphaeraceae archaeon]|nr:hypothetical protein [Nitrososphaeraceae archaeon]